MEGKQDKRVLVVDDEENIRNISKRILSKKRLMVKTARSAEVGWELIKKEEDFNAILLDIDLPGMSGIDFLKKMKGKNISAEVVMVSGKGTIEDAVEAMKLGAYDYITKPFDINKLRTVVKKAVEKQALSRELDILQAVNSIIEKISRLKPVEEIMESIIDFLMEATGADGGSIGIWDDSKELIVIEVAKGAGADESIGKKIKKGERLCGWVAEHRAPVFLNNSPNMDKRFKNIYPRKEISSGISVPIVNRDEFMGVLNIKKINSKKKFTRKDFEVSSLIATQAAFAVKNAADYEKLLDLDKLKDEFIANVSHELRTPLQSIMVSCEIIEQELPEDQMVKVCLRNSKRMHKLISQLLDFSRWESVGISLNKEKINLKQLCREVEEDIGHKIKQNNIKVSHKFKKKDEVYGDHEALKRVMINLLDNSIKYSNKGSKVKVFGKKKRYSVEISVEDNGKGIPANEKENIFNRFHQQEPGKLMTAKHKGLGLGLSMVKKIVEAHGGKVGVDSVSGKGSRFYFTIPRFKEGKHEK